MSSRFYLLLACMATGLLIAFLFWIPQKRGAKASSRLWQEKWQKIEYVEGNQKPRLRLLRIPGLLRDSYYAEIPATGLPGTYLRRRGNYTVKNLFSNWYEPRLLAYYPETNRENAKKELRETGLQKSKQKLLFYNTPSASPVTLTLGQSSANASAFVRSSLHPALLLVIPEHLLKEQFTKEGTNYWSRQVLQFPKESYIASIQIQQNTKNPNNDNRVSQSKSLKQQQTPSLLHLQQKQKRVEKTVKKFWTARQGVSSQEQELPSHYGRQLANAVKQIRIDLFASDKAIQARDSTRELWEKGKDFLIVKIKIHNGDDFTLGLGKLKGPKVIHEKVEYVLLQNSMDKGQVDYTRQDRMQTLLERSQAIHFYLKGLGKKSKTKAKQSK